MALGHWSYKWIKSGGASGLSLGFSFHEEQMDLEPTPLHRAALALAEQVLTNGVEREDRKPLWGESLVS